MWGEQKYPPAAYREYASLLRISGALHLGIFDQPVEYFFRHPDKRKCLTTGDNNG